VSFIAVASVYVYLRECCREEEPPVKTEGRPAEVVPANLRDVA
jgi:hypothetical protein